MRGQSLAIASLWCLVLGSAMAVVYSSHLCRQLYSQLSLLEREKNSLQIEWSKYLIEQNSLASLSRVEQLAADKLGMRVPEAGEIVMVQQQ